MEKIYKNKAKKGFTLIELLISIVLFMIFLGLVSQSYLGIVRAQREANEVRKMYSDVRGFMDFLAEEIRLSAIDYDCYSSADNQSSPVSKNGGLLPNFDLSKIKLVQVSDFRSNICGPYEKTIVDGKTNNLMLIKKGGMEKTSIYFNDVENKIIVHKYQKTESGGWAPVQGYEDGKEFMSGRVKISNLTFAIFPDVNPYVAYSNNAVQFQPKVTVFMSAVNSDDVNIPFNFDFQTTVSSRVYSKKV